jgi:hypothetical protein
VALRGGPDDHQGNHVGGSRDDASQKRRLRSICLTARGRARCPLPVRASGSVSADGDDARILPQPHSTAGIPSPPSPPAMEWLRGPDPALVASANRAAAGCRAGQSDDRSPWSTGHPAMASLARRARHWTQRSTRGDTRR